MTTTMMKKSSQDKITEEKLRSTLQSAPSTKNSRLVMALRAGYLALTRNVSLLGEHRIKFKELLKTIFMFRFDWLVDSHNYTSKLFESYQKLLLNLLSSNSCFVPPVCRTLVKALTLEDMDEINKDTNKEASERVCEQVRNTIIHMIAVSPSCQKGLQRALRDHFPHATKSVEFISYYMINLLRLSDSIPLMREHVFCLIVEKIIKIDVLVSSVDEREDVKDGKDEEGDDDDDTKDDAEKLDRIMCLMFEFLKCEMTKKDIENIKDEDEHEEETVVRNKSRGWSEVSDLSDRPRSSRRDNNCKDMFMTVLRAFRTTVIHTHQSTCVQFIVFYAAQFDESLPSTFVGLLLDALANDTLSEALRMTCICYCASFVSRAKYVELGTVRAAIAFLAFWLHDYVEKRSIDTELNDDDYDTINSTEEKKKEDKIMTRSGLYVTRRDRVHTNRHNTFYCAVQALLYTLCFKTKAILSESDGISFLQELNLSTLLSSSLNPLSRCLPDVVLEFQSLAIHVGWSTSLVEVLKRTVLPSNSATTTTKSKRKEKKEEEEDAHDQEEEKTKKSIAFDTFFPFDPYLLPKSGQTYIHEGIYNKWDESSMQVDIGEDDEDDEEEGEVKDEDEDEKEEQELEHERYRQRLMRVGLATQSSSLVSSDSPDQAHPNLLENTFQKRKYRRSRSRGFSFESEKRRRKRPRIQSGDESSFDTTIDRQKSRAVSMEDRTRMYSFDEILSRHSAPKRVEGSQSFGVSEKEDGENERKDDTTEDLTYLAGSW